VGITELTPTSKTNTIVLSPSAAINDIVEDLVPLGVYTPSDASLSDEKDAFVAGAKQQINYVYNKLGGEVIDIEITNGQVYSSYEQACVVYSKIMNMHQAENVLSNVLGSTTASFDANGQVSDFGRTGEVGANDNLNLKYPKFDFSYARRVTEGISSEASLGGTNPVYSASIDLTPGQQNYDLQKLMQDQSLIDGSEFKDKINNAHILIKKVYYKTRRASWNFFGIGGGGLRLLSGQGGYSQHADASTFEIIPVWENKLQAINYEDHIKTRTSDYSYEIKNNWLKLFPCPTPNSGDKIWIEFQVPADVWSDDNSGNIGLDGINNMNNLPFENLPYSSINQIGKQWIRDYSCALSKEMVGIVRSKFSSIPTPGGEVTLDGPAMISAAKEEMEKLATELKETLEKLTYSKLMQSDTEILDSSKKIISDVPNLIYVG